MPKFNDYIFCDYCGRQIKLLKDATISKDGRLYFCPEDCYIYYHLEPEEFEIEPKSLAECLKLAKEMKEEDEMNEMHSISLNEYIKKNCGKN